MSLVVATAKRCLSVHNGHTGNFTLFVFKKEPIRALFFRDKLSGLILSNIDTERAGVIAIGSGHVVVDKSDCALDIIGCNPTEQPGIDRNGSAVANLHDQRATKRIVADQPLVRMLPIALRPPFLVGP